MSDEVFFFVLGDEGGRDNLAADDIISRHDEGRVDTRPLVILPETIKILDSNSDENEFVIRTHAK